MVTESQIKGPKPEKDPVFVVLQLSGGNDFMSTVVPYNDPHYFEFRKTVGISENEALLIDGGYGFHPSMGPIKDLWDKLPKFRDSMDSVPTLHIPNKKTLIEKALTDRDFMVNTKKDAAKSFYPC